MSSHQGPTSWQLAVPMMGVICGHHLIHLPIPACLHGSFSVFRPHGAACGTSVKVPNPWTTREFPLFTVCSPPWMTSITPMLQLRGGNQLY